MVFVDNNKMQKLAIKKMNLQATKEFLAELQVLTNVHHTNLVSGSPSWSAIECLDSRGSSFILPHPAVLLIICNFFMDPY